jgi:hypothetical protein
MGATALGQDELAQRLAESSEEAQRRIQTQFPRTFENIESTEGFGEALQYLTEGAIESAPFMLGSLATGGLARGGAKALLPAAKVVQGNRLRTMQNALARQKAVGRAGTAGMFAGVAVPETGFTYGELEQETGEHMPGRALVAGGIKGALDTFSLSRGIRGAFNRRSPFALEVAKTAGREGITEGLQEATDIGAVRSTREDPFTPMTPDEFSRAMNAAAIGSFAGGVMGGAGGAINRVLNPDTSEQEAFAGLAQEFMRQNPRFAEEEGWTEDDIREVIFGGNRTTGRAPAEYGALSEFEVEYESPEEIIYSQKGMPWPSVQLQTIEAEKRKGEPLRKPRQDAVASKLETLIFKNPLAKATAKQMFEEGATEQEVRDYLIERSGYSRQTYLEFLRRKAEREGLPVNTLIQEEASKLTEAYPHLRVASESSPEEFLEQFELIAKEKEIAPDQYGGREFEMTEDEVFGWLEDTDDISTDETTRQAKQARAIVRVVGNYGKARRYEDGQKTGEIILPVVLRNGNEANRAINLMRLVHHSMRRTPWREGETLTERIAAALFTGMSSLANSTAFQGIDMSALQNLTQTQKESLVVFSMKNKETGQRRDWTLAELEKTGLERKIAAARAAARKVQNAQDRLERLAGLVDQLRGIPENIFLAQQKGEFKTIDDLISQYMELQETYPNLLEDLERAEKEYVQAKQEEADRIEKEDRKAKAQEAMADEPGIMDVEVGESLVVEVDGKTVPARQVLGTRQAIDPIRKKPIFRAENDPASLFNFRDDMYDELFELNKGVDELADIPDMSGHLFQHRQQLFLMYDRFLLSDKPLDENDAKDIYRFLFSGKSPSFVPSKKWLKKVVNERIEWADKTLKELRMTDEEKFDQDIKDIYGSRSLYPSEKAVPPNMIDTEVIESEEWALYTQLVDEIFRATGISRGLIEVLTPNQAYEKSMDQGKHDDAAAILNGNMFGFVQQKVDGSGFYMYVNPFLERSYVHSTLAHEVGHLIHFITLHGTAGEKVIHDEYMRYLDTLDEDTTTVRELLAKRRNYRVIDVTRDGFDVTNTPAEAIFGEQDFAYLTNFYEWFADRAMTRLLDRRPPRSKFERLLVKMLDKLRRLFNLTQTHATVEEYVDEIMQRSSSYWGGARAPITYFQETPYASRAQAQAQGGEQTFTPLNDIYVNIDAYLQRVIGRPIEEFRRELLVQTALLSGVDMFGAAFHESMKQAVFEPGLFTEPELTLLGNVAMSNRVQRQLLYLLRNHPEARRAVANNPTSALAYAYQFWVTGQLNLDARPDTLFRRIADFFRELFGIIADSAAAEEMFEHFINGRALLRKNEPSDHDFVMRTATRDTRLQRAMQDFVIPKWEAFANWKVFDTVFKAAGQRMYDTGNPVLRTLNNMIYAMVNSEGVPMDMLTARNAAKSMFDNEVRNVMKGFEDDREFAIEVIKWLNAGKPASVDSENDVERVAAGLRSILSEIRHYMLESGLKVGYQENYFPWVFDRDYLLAHQQEFIDLMSEPEFQQAFVENGISPAELYHRLVSGTGSIDEAINLEDIGHIPALAAKQARTMGWVDELATPEQRERFGAFMSEDLGFTLATYIGQAVKRSEYHKRFGNGTLKTMLAQAEHYGATPEDMELAKAYIDAVMGTHGYKTNDKLRKILGMEAAPPGEVVNPKLQRLMGIMMVYQNVRTLALGTLTSMADIVGIAVRTGDLSMTYGAMKAGIAAAYKHAQGEEAILVDMAEMLGTIDRHLTMEALNWEYGGVYMRGPERRINEGFFKVIGLQAWTRATRIIALEAAQRFLKRHIENPNQHSERFLSELGITPEDIRFNEDGTVKILNTNDRWAIAARVRQLEDTVDVAYTRGEFGVVESDIALENQQYDKVPSSALIKELVRLLNRIPGDPNAARVAAAVAGNDILSIEEELANRGYNPDQIVAMHQIAALRERLQTVEGELEQLHESIYSVDADLSFNRSLPPDATTAAAIENLETQKAEFLHWIEQAEANMQQTMERLFEAQQNAAEEGIDITQDPPNGFERAAEFHNLQQELDRDERSKSALNRFIDGSILRPNATLRPVWGSDPHWMLFFHLKSFMYAFHERIIKRIIRETGEGNLMPLLMSGMFIPVMMMLDYLRDRIQHGDEDDPQKVNWDWDDHALEALQRSGMLGLGMLAVDAGHNIKMGGYGFESFAGPTYQQLDDILTKEDYELEEAVPGANIIKYWMD